MTESMRAKCDISKFHIVKFTPDLHVPDLQLHRFTLLKTLRNLPILHLHVTFDMLCKMPDDEKAY